MVSSKDLAESLIKMIEKTGDEKSSLKAFIAFLEENKLQSQLPSVIRILEKKSSDIKKWNALVIESPFEISKDTTEAIRKKSGAEASDEVSFVKRPDLIGGFRATYKGHVLDASLKHNLQTLKKQLIK